jgi:hypothetical protein
MHDSALGQHACALSQAFYFIGGAELLLLGAQNQGFHRARPTGPLAHCRTATYGVCSPELNGWCYGLHNVLYQEFNHASHVHK